MPEELLEPIIIPKNERLDELERDVKYYMTILPKPSFVNNKIYSRVSIEDFKDPMDQLMWEIEEIRRCKEGHDGMNPKMYFYFNYCKMVNIESGIIPVEYRVSQHDWYNFLLEQQRSREWGIVGVKRRRYGMSWIEASDVLHDVLFTKFFHVGMNSKGEKDSIDLFSKVKFIYNNLPAFLRIKTGASNTQMYMDFSYFTKDKNGQKIKAGNQSQILVKAPVSVAFEGQMLNKWVCDEGGKIDILPQMWAYTEPCLMQDTRRPGIPIVFGTSGEVTKEGAGLRDMWKNADAYKLKRYFISGVNGLIRDKFGNDMVEDAVRWIVYERHRKLSLDPKLRNDFIQQYPLTVSEAFRIPNMGGVGDIVKINAQLDSLREDPPQMTMGTFVIGSKEDVIWSPNPNGHAVMYENRIAEAEYFFGSDPADHDDPITKEPSNLSLIGQRKRFGTMPPQVVIDMTYRPDKVVDFYKQALLALLYYNKSKVLIERNRFNMISYFDQNGYKHLISTTPTGVVRLLGGRVNTLGINVDDNVKEYGAGLITEYIDEYWNFVPDEELLIECTKYGSENTDRVMAWMLCLIQARNDKRDVAEAKKRQESMNMPRYYNVGGKIVRA